MTIFLTTIIFLILGVGAFIIDNLLNQVRELESHISEKHGQVEEIEQDLIKYHTYFLKLFEEAYSEMRRVDKRGSFSSDDEVGFSFKVIFRAIEDVTLKLRELDSNSDIPI